MRQMHLDHSFPKTHFIPQLKYWDNVAVCLVDNFFNNKISPFGALNI